MYTDKRPFENTGYLKSKGRALTGKQPWSHLDDGLAAFRSENTTYFYLCHSICTILS
jgi:hypothetical protein